VRAVSGLLPLAEASRRLRRPAGRPRRSTSVNSALLEPAHGAARDFVPSRGLPIPAAAVYTGVPVRALWRLIAAGQLAPVRVPGVRRVLLLRDDLDRLLERSRKVLA